MKEQALDSLTRREFLKLTSLASLGLATASSSILGCDAQITTPSRSDFKPYNTNYQGRSRPFHESTTPGFIGTPGVEYYCSNGTPMITTAEGRLLSHKSAGRGSGEVIELVHRPKAGEQAPFFLTIYGHISVDNDFIKRFKKGDTVPRGTVVGQVYYKGSAKLMTIEAFNANTAYWVNPENYGRHYTQLNYWDGNPDFDKELISKYVERFNKQVKCLETLVKMSKTKDLSHFLKIPTSTPPNHPVHPAIIDKWRRVEQMYGKEPDKLTGSKEEIEHLKKEFYDNQPIILTLPFKKP